MKWSIALLLATASLATRAPAQETSTIHTRYNLSVAGTANMERIPPRQGLSNGDQRFLISMARVHIAEIQFGELAMKVGGDWAHGYGKDMQREHTMALEEMKKLAHDNSFALPTDVDTATKKAFNRLAALSGPAFDRAYRQMMIEGHTMVLAATRHEIHNGYNSDIRGYAVTMEAGVGYHLRLAQEQTTMLGTKDG